MAKKSESLKFVAPDPEAKWIDMASETDVLYLYDESYFSTLKESTMSECGGDFRFEEEYEEFAGRGIVLALLFTVREREDGFHGFVYQGAPPISTHLPPKPLYEPGTGKLHLPTGKLRIETYSALRIGPDKSNGKGITIQFKEGHFDVCMNQAIPIEMAGGHQVFYSYLSLTPRSAESKVDSKFASNKTAKKTANKTTKKRKT